MTAGPGQGPDLGDDPDGDLAGYDGPVAEPTFLQELEHLINRHSVENESDTPDFILATYLRGCLDNFAHVMRERDRWFGFEPWPRQPVPDSNCTLGT